MGAISWSSSSWLKTTGGGYPAAACATARPGSRPSSMTMTTCPSRVSKLRMSMSSCSCREASTATRTVVWGRPGQGPSLDPPFDLDCQPARRDGPAHTHCGLLRGGDAPHDRPTQAAAALSAADDPEEALAQPLQV